MTDFKGYHRKFNSFSAKLLAAAVMLGSLAACSDVADDYEPEVAVTPTPEQPKLPEGRTYISMTIVTGSGHSRSDDWEGPTWGNSYNESDVATQFERAIDPRKVTVMLYNSEGKFLAELDADTDSKDVVIQTISEEEGTYQVYFDISNLELELEEEYVAAVIVNYSGILSSKEINSATFSMSNLVGATGGQDPTDYYKGRMPMFGFIRWTYGTTADQDDVYATPIIGTVELLRAVCKIEVSLGDPEVYPKTKYMTINPEKLPRLAYVNRRHINTMGHIAPERSKWINPLLKSTRDITFQDSFYELVGNRWSSTTTEHLAFPARSEDGRTYYIYLPEAAGISLAPNFDALRLNVTVLYDDPADNKPARSITGTLFPSIYYDEVNQCYPSYSNFNRWKLVRNHIYSYTITDISDETMLNYNISVTGNQTVNVPDFD